MICYNDQDLEQAKIRIKEATEATDYLIIEQKLKAVNNYCVQYAYAPDLGIKYLGTAQQLTNEYGFITGMKMLMMYLSMSLMPAKKLWR